MPAAKLFLSVLTDRIFFRQNFKKCALAATLLKDREFGRVREIENGGK